MFWLLLFLPSLNFLEVFANSINTQSYLAISVFIILLFGSQDKLLKTQYGVVLLGFYLLIIHLRYFPLLLLGILMKKRDGY